jgi:prepilin-type processing-associated H-X9-DG protein
VFGASAVGKAAAAGHVHLLVVEESFTVPGHTIGGSGPGGAPDGPDDLVDDLIATVLLADGHVELVDDGALADVGRIGALLRR